MSRNVTLLSEKVVDLVKQYTKGYQTAEDVLDALEQVLIEDKYITPEELNLGGSNEGQDL
jgi:hypothetical protein